MRAPTVLKLLAVLGTCTAGAWLFTQRAELPVVSVAPEQHLKRGIKRPPPTENGQGDGLGQHNERKSKRGRKEWIKRMHRSKMEWREAERANGLAQVARRRTLLRAPPDDFGGAWVERGTNNQAGRMHVTRTSTDGSHLYAGSAFGGLWRGTPEGTDWTPLGDATYGGVHFLEVLPAAVAGDPDVLVTSSDGGIVLRSIDGGATWESPSFASAPWWTRRLVKATDGSNTLYLVNASDSGVLLYRSTDLGATWQEVLDFGGYYSDLWVPRDGEGGVYIIDQGVLRTSFDQGATWEDGGDLPEATYYDLVGSEAGDPTLYAVVDNADLWRSDDAGATWAEVSTLTDYWGGTLSASSVDAQMFVFGGVELHKSFDGGESFATQNYWYDYYGDPANLLHADVPGIDAIPNGTGGETWFINTDGGTYSSVDGLESVKNLSLSGLRVGQYYDVLTSNADPTHVAIGAQDQGYQLTNDVEQVDNVFVADQVLSGDYGHLTSGDGTHKWVFSVYPGFVLVQHGETAPDYYYLDFPGGESYVPWLPPIVADPDTPSNFYFPASHLYLYDRAGGGSWTITQYSEQDFSVSRGEYVSRMAFSPVDSSRAWATTSEGRAWWSDDKGLTWTMSPSMVPDENWYYGQAIAPSLTDKDTVTIGGSGYGVPAVYRSTDGGQTYFPWGQGLPDTLVYTLVEAPDGSGTMFAGTQTSAYRRGPTDDAWVDITTAAAPITTYWDAEALTEENTIRFATYGRGVWDYQLDPAGTGCYPPHDEDGDGVNCDADCDDADATVFPGATEACDGRDVDCDDATPAGGEVDQDADGAIGCDDCNDLDPARHPGATEVCGDGIDEDCDGNDPPCQGTGDREGPNKACGCASAPAGGALGASGLAAGLVAAGLLLARRRRA